MMTSDNYLELAAAYAASRKTSLLKAYRSDDGTITIILESGSKEKLTEDEIIAAIKAKAKEDAMRDEILRAKTASQSTYKKKGQSR